MHALIGFCSGGSVSDLFLRSILRLVQWENEHHPGRITPPDGGIVHIRSGPRIASARNAVVRTFLADKPKAEWLLMLDTDMVFEPDLLDHLISVADRDDRPIVSALAFGGGYGETIFPTMYRMGYAGLKVMETFPPDELVAVDGTGAACLLLHRDALVKVGQAYAPPYPWFVEAESNGMEIGEDLAFCIRARRCGLPIYVHTGIQVGHVKPKVLTIADWHGTNESNAG